MKQDNVNYLVVGIFVLSMLILLLVVLFRITGNSTETVPYFVDYTNITGINKGSPVTYGGYQIGQVDDIIPRNVAGRTQYHLELGLKAGWKIPSDSVARIISPGLLSDDLIDIAEGESSTYIQPNGVIRGQDSINIMSTLNTVAYEIKDLSDNSIKPLINNLSRHVDAIGSGLNTSIPMVTASINRLLDNLNSSANELAELLNEKNQQHLANAFENADLISQNLSTLAQGFNNAHSQIEQILNNSNQILTDNSDDIRHSVVDLRNSLQIISENINAIIYNLEGTSRNFNEFSRQIRDNPAVLLNGKAPRDDGVQR